MMEIERYPGFLSLYGPSFPILSQASFCSPLCPNIQIRNTGGLIATPIQIEYVPILYYTDIYIYIYIYMFLHRYVSIRISIDTYTRIVRAAERERVQESSAFHIEPHRNHFQIQLDINYTDDDHPPWMCLPPQAARGPAFGPHFACQAARSRRGWRFQCVFLFFNQQRHPGNGVR